MSVNLNKKITGCSNCGNSFENVRFGHYSAVKNGQFVKSQSDKEAIRTAICLDCENQGFHQCRRCAKVHLHGSLGECAPLTRQLPTLKCNPIEIVERAKRDTPQLYKQLADQYYKTDIGPAEFLAQFTGNDWYLAQSIIALR